MRRVLISGYKATELGIFSLKHPGIAIIKKAIKKQLQSLIDDGLEWVIISGQWGVEIWAAEVVIEMKQSYSYLQLAVITPFIDQEENWNEEKKEVYSNVLRNADYLNSVSKKKYEGGWQFKEKNKFLLRNTDGLILIYDEENPGSPRFMKELAEQWGYTNDYMILTINAFDLQSIADEEQLNSY
ncbi:DUF1273 family protein [Paenibacillus albiflavus]|uniref:UPF0398 protein E0485_00925 n=1 Tax=Paenibacillus albiflavus TaxID=2545760 RepID=A0A4R4EQU7_9BACL|nr:DUF1273 family protein [Paenibacillus albiflavus]